MLRRLILALLIACLAFPAAAMPILHAPMGHGPAAMPPMAITTGVMTDTSAHHDAMPAPHHDTSHHDDGMGGALHECIGCMARYDGVALPEAPLMAAHSVLCFVATAQIAGSGPGPETPPPRC